MMILILQTVLYRDWAGRYHYYLHHDDAHYAFDLSTDDYPLMVGNSMGLLGKNLKHDTTTTISINFTININITITTTSTTNYCYYYRYYYYYMLIHITAKINY